MSHSKISETFQYKAIYRIELRTVSSDYLPNVTLSPTYSVSARWPRGIGKAKTTAFVPTPVVDQRVDLQCEELISPQISSWPPDCVSLFLSSRNQLQLNGLDSCSILGGNLGGVLIIDNCAGLVFSRGYGWLQLKNYFRF